MSPRRKKKIPKIRELTEFNEIFSVDILMNKRYTAPVILLKKLLHFFRSINFEPRMFVNLCYASKIREKKDERKKERKKRKKESKKKYK